MQGHQAHSRYVEARIALSESMGMLADWAHPDQAPCPGCSSHLIGFRINTLSTYVYLIQYRLNTLFVGTVRRNSERILLYLNKHGPSNGGRASCRSGASHHIRSRELRIHISTDHHFHPPLPERSREIPDGTQGSEGGFPE